MKLLAHYLKIIGRIISSKYSYSRIKLLWCYTELVYKSVVFHKFRFRSVRNDNNPFEESIMGFSVKFFNYIQAITLCEEIFIFETYKFSADSNRPFIIDCGSSIGLSLLYFKTTYPLSKIVAFEPDQQAFELLQDNVRKNHLSNVICYNLALTNTTGKVSLFKAFAPGSPGMSLIQTPGTYSVNVQTKRLSDIVAHENIDFLKIDVEGSETQILSDMLETGKIQYIKQMTIEFHSSKIDERVEDYLTKLSDSEFEFCEHKAIYTKSSDRIFYFSNRNVLHSK